MRFIALLLALLMGVANICKATETLIITGYYTGKDLYVQNPLLPDNKTFSTNQVFVNESLVINKPITSAFIVDLSHLKLDESVEVRIVHKNNYPPKIINGYVIRELRFQKSVSFMAVKDVFRWTSADRQTVRWLTAGEKGSGTFELQRADQETWVKIYEVPAKEKEDNSVYRIRVSHEPGENTYRLRLVDRDGYVSYSPLIRYLNKQ